ncbi:putative lysophosphatidylcholine acyltransferase / lyso-PAF acetyltransferase [Monocercomonoides exilis]|uniref:putative lysophosphatidylcholine acyltransferase / lyso-PAF acetyltransferase n=1 Tax=Monocercomonoides exilis TaxID=2049356 RepID=UPI003559AE8C|nr:putative lysophosphatidylcholine acyltransferase / lyso-PAF acetyltransferase [Monocercomonoides exilis]|eukprot:MONOS_4739.1-p1 / transcript=MONOS_4739.1 / gene=MONOS_4739 / organism=Monocercomonoides_exilis_PA203 / gene_product=lysophosphatidylcholine acyltransferase / lyso-PAF acetyltransferase [EC:2.3.1.23 2.3.1.67] / transcript_product=lysophosphatidylcholine acyltransferase / lyso-PAF acetyltransferase [EC:2.3.1.23 2.3.1.67] / location=Mono_scaffold00130:44833-46377(+) / protein_length=515 / sequence_SO=supercontig / SO=protein_coding / is_pseudo=false
MLLYAIFFFFIGPADQPQPKIIRIIRKIVAVTWARFILYLYGFFWISEHGKIQKDTKLVIANHSSCFDMFYLIWKLCPSFAIAEFVGKNCFLGPLSRVFNCIAIDRKSSGNSSSFLSKLQQRLESNDGKYPPCMIFPEGATSNGQCLNYFHSGAFVPGSPIQPIVLRYKDKINPTQWSVRSWPFHYLSVMCNFTNRLEVIILPVYHPSSFEQLHPRLFAQNVKNAMSHSLEMVHFLKEKKEEFYNKRAKTERDCICKGDSIIEEVDFMPSAYYPQTQFTYKDRKSYELLRETRKGEWKKLEPRTQQEICEVQLQQFFEIKRRIRSKEMEFLENTKQEASKGGISIANTECLNTENHFSLDNDSTTVMELDSKISKVKSDLTSNLSLSSLFYFILPCPFDSFDYNVAHFYSSAVLPSEEVMRLLENNQNVLSLSAEKIIELISSISLPVNDAMQNDEIEEKNEMISPNSDSFDSSEANDDTISSLEISPSSFSPCCSTPSPRYSITMTPCAATTS